MAFAAGGQAGTPVYGIRVIKSYPHDRGAFTQGIIYLDGYLYEGTGLNGRSSLRKVKLETGEVKQKAALPEQFFGEGITNWGNQLIQLTWQSQIGLVFDGVTFQPLRTFRYPGEGWGLTHDSKRLIMSDGSAALRFWDPQTFQETGRLTVRDGNEPVQNLNELEYIKGEIYANVWQAERIARISPATGKVLSWIDCSGLLTAAEREGTDVLNGIAWDSRGDRIFITGKLWPKLFEIKIDLHPRH